MAHGTQHSARHTTHGTPDIADDLLELVGLEERGDLARVEQVVDVFQEALVDDLCVAEEEDDGLALHTGDHEQLLDVLPELGCAVAARELDLHALVVGHVCGEARQTLLAGPTDADEQHVAAGLRDDARDARHVAHGVAEEDEVHLLRRCEVVVVEVVAEQLRRRV
jgi:hypothetical protein